MKVVHLNTYDGNGGAGRASYRLNHALVSAGAQSKLFTYLKFSKKADINALYPNFWGKLYATLTVLAERYLPKFYEKDLKLPFSLSFFGKDIHRHPAILEADIIHLHWINHGFLNPQNLSKLASLNKPIVWTLHDSNTFTGGCHVRFNCTHYLNSCGNCPLLKTPANDDVSHQIWKRKNEAYQQLKATYITPSHWLGLAAKQSGLLKNYPVSVIPNTLETKIFKPINKKEARATLNLPQNQFLLLSGFMPSKKDAHKGTSYLIEAIDLWIATHPELIDKATLIVFGNRYSETAPSFKIDVTFLGTINDDDKLANAYAAADVFLTTSLEDNLPNTVMESLACGTPVVSFTTGGIPDMVHHQHNGYLARYKDSKDFAAGINWVYHHPDKEKLNEKARETVMENFSEDVIADKHIKLYQNLLNGKKV